MPSIPRRALLGGLGTTAVGGTAAFGLTAGGGPQAPAAPQNPAAPTEKAPPILIGEATGDRIHVMTFNIRFEQSDVTQPGEPDHWPERRPILIELLQREQPGLLGVQEMEHGQISAIEEALPGHRMIGFGRQGGSKDEHSAIFYQADRFEVLGWDQFWLSDTPAVIGSMTWGNEYPRIVVWARLRDLSTDTEFVMVNTHFDHQSEEARAKSADALVELLAAKTIADLPTIVTGDFNTPAPDSESYDTLVADGPLTDSWETATTQLTPQWGTFLGYEEPEEGARRIDWILATEDVTVHEAAIDVSRGKDGRFPSDHAPVHALIDLP